MIYIRIPGGLISAFDSIINGFVASLASLASARNGQFPIKFHGIINLKIEIEWIRIGIE